MIKITEKIDLFPWKPSWIFLFAVFFCGWSVGATPFLRYRDEAVGVTQSGNSTTRETLWNRREIDLSGDWKTDDTRVQGRLGVVQKLSRKTLEGERDSSSRAFPGESFLRVTGSCFFPGISCMAEGGVLSWDSLDGGLFFHGILPGGRLRGEWNLPGSRFLALELLGGDPDSHPVHPEWRSGSSLESVQLEYGSLFWKARLRALRYDRKARMASPGSKGTLVLFTGLDPVFPLEGEVPAREGVRLNQLSLSSSFQWRQIQAGGEVLYQEGKIYTARQPSPEFPFLEDPSSIRAGALVLYGEWTGPPPGSLSREMQLHFQAFFLGTTRDRSDTDGSRNSPDGLRSDFRIAGGPASLLFYGEIPERLGAGFQNRNFGQGFDATLLEKEERPGYRPGSGGLRGGGIRAGGFFPRGFSGSLALQAADYLQADGMELLAEGRYRGELNSRSGSVEWMVHAFATGAFVRYTDSSMNEWTGLPGKKETQFYRRYGLSLEIRAGFD